MFQKYLFVIVALMLLVISWEGQKNEAVVAASATIPEEAIRLRILANSDNAEDQWLKRQVRDRVVEYMGALTDRMDRIETARRIIRARLPEITQLATGVVREHGYDYRVDVDYGMVPFPTKLYGNQVYPAGDYEALRITLGRGTGANWWCVLFPPLCFVDMSNADAVPDDKVDGGEADKRVDTAGHYASVPTEQQDDRGVEVRFFFIDWLMNVLEKIKSFFTAILS